MKLRLQGSSLRLRLTRSEVRRLSEAGVVEESVSFAGEQSLVYRLQTAIRESEIGAVFENGAITVWVAPQTAGRWTGSEDVGIYARSGSLTISIEKDFRCLIRALDESERDAYPNPLDACGTAVGEKN